MVWPDDMPSEIARQAQVRPIDGGQRKEPKPQAAGQASQGKGNGPKAAKRPRKRPVLAAVVAALLWLHSSALGEGGGIECAIVKFEVRVIDWRD